MGNGADLLLGPPAVILVVAGVAKALRPFDTARALATLWSPLAPMVRPLAVGEIAVGVAVLAVGGRPGAVALAVSYAGFAAFLGWALTTSRPVSTCGCFGEPDTPATASHMVACLALAAVGLAAAATGPVAPVALALARSLASDPTGGPALVVLLGALTYALYVLMALLPRTVAARRAAGGRS